MTRNTPKQYQALPQDISNSANGAHRTPRSHGARMAGLAALAAAAALLLLNAGSAHAQTSDDSQLHLSGNLGAVSQYVFRGTTQTNGKPALQGGFDLTHDNGLYAGIWMSNISWISDTNPAASASLEADLYAGWKPALNDWLNADMGVLHYAYPGSYPAGMTNPDTTEIYAGLDAKWIAFKYSYSTGNTFGNASTSGSTYADLSLNHALLAGINGIAHIGRQRYTGPNSSVLSYTDWKIGVTRDFSGYLFGLSYTDTNAADAGYTIRGKNIGRNQLVLSLNKTF